MAVLCVGRGALSTPTFVGAMPWPLFVGRHVVGTSTVVVAPGVSCGGPGGDFVPRVGGLRKHLPPGDTYTAGGHFGVHLSCGWCWVPQSGPSCGPGCPGLAGGQGGRARPRRAPTDAEARGRDRYAAAERAEAGQRQCTGAVRARRLQRGRLAGLVGTRAVCDGRLFTESQNAPRARDTLHA